MMQAGYTIKTEYFEGPFDLLLFFIERDELDIYDIPISEVTNDFLEYIKALEKLDIDVASEFILVAATLMRIKARMLIPRKALDEDGNEIDPRDELVQKLLEYKQFKDVIDEIQAFEEERSKKYGRGNVSYNLKQIANKALVDEELESLNLYKLLKTFQTVMEKYEADKNKVVHSIVQYPFTIENQRKSILSSLKIGGRVQFQILFNTIKNRVQAIVTFLALLEMLNGQEIKIIQGEGVNNFWLEA